MKAYFKILLYALAVIIGASLMISILHDLYVIIVEGGTWKDGTGFSGKTLWDWLELLIIPIALGLGALWFNRQEKRRELDLQQQRFEEDQKITRDSQYQSALQSYLDTISELLLKEDLFSKRASKGEPVRDVAQTRTTTMLRFLDVDRRNIIIQFLRDAGLADGLLSGASLAKADLKKTNLNSINLSRTNLNGTILIGAYLGEANLSEAGLRGADLRGTRMEYADLSGADLFEADISGASLLGANLNEAKLQGANLNKVDLTRASITNEQLSSVKSLINAILPNGESSNPDVHDPPAELGK